MLPASCRHNETIRDRTICRQDAGYVFSVMVGMARRAVPARVVAGGTNIQATPAIEGVAPLHAARTSQRDVPTTLNRYDAGSTLRVTSKHR